MGLWAVVSEVHGIAEGETGFDRVLSFMIPRRNARGRAVRLGPVLNTILSAHAYPTAIQHLLAEALTLTALMGSLFKDDGSQLTIQAQAEGGIVDLMVCDYRGGELRGYVRHDADRLARLGANPSLYALFGKGYLAMTFDVGPSGQRYQGIVPLGGESLAQACEAFFAQSEQVPTLIRVATRAAGGSCVSGGMLIQHLPEGEDGRERHHVQLDHPEWEHISIMAGSVKHDELVDGALSLEQLVWRLFQGEGEVRIEQRAPLGRGCRCDENHYRDVLACFPEADREDMRDADGRVSIDCAFCSKQFRIEI